MKRAPLHLIVAMAKNRVIGKDGQLPWRIPEDLKFFKTETLGHAIIMGRKTFDSVGRALPKRTNIVVSRTAAPKPDTIIVPTVEEAIRVAREVDPEPYVIGGSQIYADAIPFATHLHVTFIDREVEGDTFFPRWNEAEWTETQSRIGEEPDVRFVTLERTQSP